MNDPTQPGDVPAADIPTDVPTASTQPPDANQNETVPTEKPQTVTVSGHHSDLIRLQNGVAFAMGMPTGNASQFLNRCSNQEFDIVVREFETGDVQRLRHAIIEIQQRHAKPETEKGPGAA